MTAGAGFSRLSRSAGAFITGFIVVLALTAQPAHANGGGGGGGAASTCPWTQDLKLQIGKKELTVTQEMLDPKAGPQSVDGYELRPNLDQLTLQVITPRGQIWEASMTRLVRGKRCSAYYVGKPFIVEETEAVIYAPNRSNSH